MHKPLPDPVDPDFLPVSGLDLPRFAGIPTFMRLPQFSVAEPGKTEIGLVGVPWDAGTTNRPGARHGPRAVRDASTMIRMVNQATGIAPFHLARVADLGDVPVNPASLDDTLERIEAHLSTIHGAGILPLTVGGDHLTSLPVLRVLAKDRPVGMVHFDAHTDLFEGYFGGFKLTHGTPFRRAVEEGLLDPKRMVQIGLRGTTYDDHDIRFAHSVGVRTIFIEEVVERGLDAVMDEARGIVGDQPAYLSFDIDVIDPSQAPGTGTPEIGGLTTREAQAMLRRLDGIGFVGADLVEVSPPFDLAGMTSWAAASLLFEILCVLAPAVGANRARARQA